MSAPWTCPRCNLNAYNCYCAQVVHNQQAANSRENQNAALGRNQMAAGNEQAALAQQQANLQQGERGIPFAQRVEIAGALDAAKKRIAELEAERPGHSVGCDRKLSDAQALNKSLAEQLESYRGAAVRSHARANQIGDEAGALRTELQTVKAENSDLRRENERLKQKAGGK